MTRVIAKDGNLKYALLATDAPIGSIWAGEVVQVECEINCNGGVVVHSTAACVSGLGGHARLGLVCRTG